VCVRVYINGCAISQSCDFSGGACALLFLRVLQLLFAVTHCSIPYDAINCNTLRHTATPYALQHSAPFSYVCDRASSLSNDWVVKRRRAPIHAHTNTNALALTNTLSLTSYVFLSVTHTHLDSLDTQIQHHPQPPVCVYICTHK